MDSKGDVLLMIMASLARQESEWLSKNVKMGIQFRYQNCEIHVNHNWFLGYTKDENGHLAAMHGVFVIYRKFIWWNYARIEFINQIVYSVISLGVF